MEFPPAKDFDKDGATNLQEFVAGTDPVDVTKPVLVSAVTSGDFKTVTLTFSLKESLFKTLYPLTRQRFYFEHAEVLEWSAEGLARLRLLTDLSPEWQQGSELQGQFCLQDGHLLSLISV